MRRMRVLGVKEDQPIQVDGAAIRMLEEGIRAKLDGSIGIRFERNLDYIESKYGHRTASVLRAAYDRANPRREGN
jgi:hypothetical protein